MLSDLMEYYGLTREFDNAGYFETQEHQKLIKELKAAIKTGRLVALAGIVGCGKTTILRRIQEIIVQEKEILVSKSLSVDKGRVNLGTLIMALFYDLATEKDLDKGRVNLGTLIMALFYDLATEKDFKIPVQPEKRERKLRDLIVKCSKPIALFIDEAHDLHSKTLVGLKRLIEVVQDSGGTLSIVLVGHPKLKNDLRRPTMEEIGARSTIFVLEGLKSSKDEYIEWLLNRCTQDTTKVKDIFAAEATAVMAEKLATPLQIIHYLSLAFEEAYKIGVKPVTSEVIESILARDIDDLEPRLTRHGYNVKALSELLNVRPAEIKSFIHGQLAPGRTQELKNEMLAAGIPL